MGGGTTNDSCDYEQAKIKKALHRHGGMYYRLSENYKFLWKLYCLGRGNYMYSYIISVMHISKIESVPVEIRFK